MQTLLHMPSQSSAAQPAQPPQPELRRAASAHPQPSSEATTKDVVEAWEVEPDVWELCGEWAQEVQVPIEPRYAGFYDSESDEAFRFDISAAVNAYLDTSAPLPACDSDRCAAAGNSTAEPRRCVCMIHPELRSLRSRLDEHELMLREIKRDLKRLAPDKSNCPQVAVCNGAVAVPVCAGKASAAETAAFGIVVEGAGECAADVQETLGTVSDPMILIVARSRSGKKQFVTCILCDEDPTKKLFTHAWKLVGTVLGCRDPPDEQYLEDTEVYHQLNEAGQRWRDQLVLSITAIGEHSKGLNALGVGSNKKKVQRAARLALAASAFCIAPDWADGSIPDPTEDGAFPALVARVRRANQAAYSAIQC